MQENQHPPDQGTCLLCPLSPRVYQQSPFPSHTFTLLSLSYLLPILPTDHYGSHMDESQIQSRIICPPISKWTRKTFVQDLRLIGQSVMNVKRISDKTSRGREAGHTSSDHQIKTSRTLRHGTCGFLCQILSRQNGIIGHVVSTVTYKLDTYGMEQVRRDWTFRLARMSSTILKTLSDKRWIIHAGRPSSAPTQLEFNFLRTSSHGMELN